MGISVLFVISAGLSSLNSEVLPARAPISRSSDAIQPAQPSTARSEGSVSTAPGAPAISPSSSGGTEAEAAQRASDEARERREAEDRARREEEARAEAQARADREAQERAAAEERSRIEARQRLEAAANDYATLVTPDVAMAQANLDVLAEAQTRGHNEEMRCLQDESLTYLEKLEQCSARKMQVYDSFRTNPGSFRDERYAYWYEQFFESYFWEFMRVNG